MRADEVDAQSEEDWDVAGAVAELPQLSDSDLEEEEGDDRDRCIPHLCATEPRVSQPLSSQHAHPLACAVVLALERIE